MQLNETINGSCITEVKESACQVFQGDVHSQTIVASSTKVEVKIIKFKSVTSKHKIVYYALIKLFLFNASIEFVVTSYSENTHCSCVYSHITLKLE